MNAGGPGQGGQGGAGSGQNNGNHDTTTSSSQQQQATQTATHDFITTTASPQTQTTTPTRSPTSASTSTSSSSSSGNQKTAIIGGVIAGIASLLLIALLAIWFLNRRQKKRIAEKRGSAEPVTYANLNDSFTGVPFGHSPRNSQHDSLLVPPPLFTPSTGASIPGQTGVGIRGGEGHDSTTDVERNSGDYFLPTYAESQVGMSLEGARSLGRLNTSHPGSGSEATISPMSVRHPDGTPTTGISPQTTGGEIPFMMPQHTRDTGISPQTTGGEIPLMMSQNMRDTMGFPVDGSDIGIHRTSTPGFPIVAPVPRHPLVHQDSLERVVREGMNATPELQGVNMLGPRNGPAGRVLSQELMRESPVLGQLNPVRLQGATAPGNLGGGVQRFESQRTVSSVSSMGISVVSDTELERLGVGSRVRHLT